MPPDTRFTNAFRKVFASADSVAVSFQELDLIPSPFLPADSPIESLPRVTVFRTSDLVRITFRFVNLELAAAGAGAGANADRALVRSRTAAPALIIADVGAQHLLEEAFFDASGDQSQFVEKGKTDPDPPGGTETPTYPVRAILARPSRLVFRVTDERIAYTEAGLLGAMRILPLNVVPHAESAFEILHWQLLADKLSERSEATRSGLARLYSTARRRIRERERAGGGIGVGLGNLLARPKQALKAVDASDAALADVTSYARLRRTAAEVEARFGAASAVAAVVDDIAAGIDIGPVFTPALKPPPPREPLQTETAIELPWRLQLSPHSQGAFAHSIDAVEHDGRVEVWHTRLGSRTEAEPGAAADAPRVTETDPATRTVRAVWSRDFEKPGQPIEGTSFPNEDLGDLSTLPPFRATLSVRDRMQLVHLTSNHHFPKAPATRWKPTPVPVENLMLTSLGGWLASEVHFPDDLPAALTIEEWRHRATMGRDQYVKVVYQGVLLPFGHRASLIKVTERRVKADGFATLYQRLYVVLRQPERRYLTSGNAGYDNVMPLRWVRILTASTPALALPKKLEPLADGQIFVPEIAVGDTIGASGQPPAGQVPFHFRMVANDIDNHLIEFQGPLVFVEKSAFSTVRATRQLARIAANAALPAFDMRGQRIAYAAPGDADDTTLSTASIAFDAVFDTVTADRTRNFVLPVMRVASAAVPAMSAFTGQSTPFDLRYADAYRANRFGTAEGGGSGKNEGELFLELARPDGTAATTPATMGFTSQSDRSGGFVSPSVDVKALARRVGPVGGDLAKLATDKGHFDVGGMFGLDAAKLFGILPLAELLPSSGGPLPKFVTQAVNAAVGVQQAVSEARAFVTERAAELTALGAGAQDAAAELAAQAQAFADAIVLIAQPPHADPGIAPILDALHDAVVDLRDELGAPDIPIARPVLERAQALLVRLADVLADAGATVDLIVKFYKGAALPESINARLDWQTELEHWPAGPAGNAIFRPGGDKQLKLASEVQAPLGGGSPTALISCALPPFELVLMGGTEFIIIRVVVMEFSVRPGRKPDVNVKLDEAKGIEFAGPLAFVETLKEIIPFDGFSDPPYLDISTSGLKAGFDLAIPDFAVGIFALTNIHLGAELVVPFIGESLEFRFFFATREDPFRVQVAFFAGGGFFAITVTPKGLKVIEAAFEFGAAVQMSFVVASGSLSVMAGIYFKLEITGGTESVELTGYFRARGEVDVLGLISACIELYLELSYRAIGTASKAVGKASISIEVSVCFLSFSVSVSCEKQFAGSSGDPTFVDMMGPYTDAGGTAHDPWSDYCGAFAIETV